MKARVKPRLQEETWSLYWRESLHTVTKCLDEVEFDLPDDATVNDLMEATANRLGWPPTASLISLEGFSGPWQRALCRGRELKPDQGVREAAEGALVGAKQGEETPSFTVVRVALKADGWKISQPDDFLLSSDDEDA